MKKLTLLFTLIFIYFLSWCSNKADFENDKIKEENTYLDDNKNLENWDLIEIEKNLDNSLIDDSMLDLNNILDELF